MSLLGTWLAPQNASQDALNGLLADWLRYVTAPISGWTAGGIVGSSDLQVQAQGTPNMSVNVTTGVAYALQDVTSTNPRAMRARLDAATSVTIPTSDPSNPRIDVISLRFAVGGSSNAAGDNWVTLVNTAGTPAASPVAPPMPSDGALYLPLAQVQVNAAVTSILTAQITQKALPVWLVAPANKLASRANLGSSAPSLVSGTAAKVNLNSLAGGFDPASMWDTATNYRCNITIPGFYQVDAVGTVDFSADGSTAWSGSGFHCETQIRKNGSLLTAARMITGAKSLLKVPVADVVQCAAGDYLELWMLQANPNSNAVSAVASATSTFMAVSLLWRTG